MIGTPTALLTSAMPSRSAAWTGCSTKPGRASSIARITRIAVFVSYAWLASARISIPSPTASRS